MVLTRLRAWLVRQPWRSHAVTLLLVIAVVYGVNAWRTQEVPPEAPDFAGVLADGTPLTLAQLRARHAGQPVALHFWAEWCPVCRTEEHSISRLVRDADTPVLTIAMQSGSAQAVQGVLRERGLDWPVLVDEDGELARLYGLPGVPTFVVIDADGRVYSADMGYTSEFGMRLRLWLASF